MQHHRSIGTTTLVALMAAHRQAQPDATQGGAARRNPADPPLDPREIDRIADRLWQAEAAADRPLRASA
jgi:hypothetical protein